MSRTLLLTFALTLIAAAPTRAQPAPAQAPPLSEREHLWAQGVARALQRQAGGAQRVWRAAHEYDATRKMVSAPSASSAAHVPPQRRVTGVSFCAGDLYVERVKFGSGVQAQAWARWLVEGMAGGPRPMIGEVRGDQLVLIGSPAVREAGFARAALAACWEGLPAPDHVDARFGALAPVDHIVATRVPGPLRDLVEQVLAAEQQHQPREDGPPTPGRVRFSSPTGPNGGAAVTEGGASLYLTIDAARTTQARAWLVKALGGHPGAVASCV
jgi:hypothetical protein